VLASAIALADVEGLEALTMRRVANALGVAPMTLYTYLPGKAELLDLMLDAAYADMPLADTSHRPWRQRLAAVAEENHALYARHPWAADISTARPPLGPGLIAKYEHELAAFDGLDLQDVTVDATLTHLLGFVLSCARVANEVATMRPAGAAGDERWWAANAPLLARVLDPASYPRAVRVGTAAGRAHGAAYRPAHAYEFGLARVLDGIGALIVVSAGQELQPGRTRPVS
jgi:AcrR family transcriptional regulator